MKRGNSMLVVFFMAVFLFTVPPGEADTISLTGTIRDFMDTHPDFAHDPPENWYDPGIVAPLLGMDGKPVYAGGTTGSTMDGAHFDQWFHDALGVNQSKNYTITLDNTITPDPCVYTFRDCTFFPIDDQLFGNQGLSHNYHFTFELHADLICPCEDTCLTFGSDDDLWVFINNQLAIDLGGIHSFDTASICLNGLVTPGDTYSLDLFFAERHVTESALRVDACVPGPSTILVLVSGLAGFFGVGKKRLFRG
jgi:fibro-slime domain-containing protein